MDFWAISIEIAVTVLMLVTLIADLLLPKETDRRAIAFLTVIGLISVFVFSLGQYHLSSSATFFMGLFIADNYSLFFIGIYSYFVDINFLCGIIRVSGRFNTPVRNEKKF